ncbi:hypothetical protein FHG87_019718 [Trinorchestia longiramus]|nr:hypothetical protein FHG87_019718 [Trinorchestia longiramus]
MKSVPSGPDVPVPEPNVTMESGSDSKFSAMIHTAKCDICRSEEDNQPDFKVVTQSIYAFCAYGITDQHYVRHEWPSRQGLKSESHKVVPHPLVEPSKILHPPLHIKLGLMKNFVKALDRKCGGFAFLHQTFQQKGMEKIKPSIFDGPQIRDLV